jgi:diketogulonate reductase-like aldo/keto reductase
VKEAIAEAYKVGYRHIDTAVYYENEELIGKAIKELKLPREELFITTKIWYSDHGYERAKKALREALRRTTLDYVDLMLIHYPGL